MTFLTETPHRKRSTIKNFRNEFACLFGILITYVVDGKGRRLTGGRCRMDSAGRVQHGATGFAAVAWRGAAFRRDLIEVVTLFPVHFKALRTIPFAQVFCRDGQMAVPASQTAGRRRYQHDFGMRTIGHKTLRAGIGFTVHGARCMVHGAR